MEVKRQLDLLDKNLESREYICGDEYNISDIAIHSWYGTLVLNNAYNASEFLEVDSYKHLGRWAKQVTKRPAYKSCLLYTSPSPRDRTRARMPSSA